MAYVLGFWYADGSLEDLPYMRGKYIRVTSTDKEVIFSIKEWLDSAHTIVKLKPNWPNGKLRYLIRIGSHRLYNALTTHGLYPNKSLTMTFPKVSSPYLSDFVRGYFDGDGCVYLERTRGKKQRLIVRRLAIIFTSSSRAFLEQLAYTLGKNVLTKQHRIYDSHRSFQLRYGTSDTIKLFKFFYKDVPSQLYFQRKFNTFQKYFALRPVNIDRDIDKILKNK